MNSRLWCRLGALLFTSAVVISNGPVLAQRPGVTEPMRQQCKAQIRGQKLRGRGKRQAAYLQCLADRINRLDQPPAARSR